MGIDVCVGDVVAMDVGVEGGTTVGVVTGAGADGAEGLEGDGVPTDGTGAVGADPPPPEPPCGCTTVVIGLVVVAVCDISVVTYDIASCATWCAASLIGCGSDG